MKVELLDVILLLADRVERMHFHRPLKSRVVPPKKGYKKSMAQIKLQSGDKVTAEWDDGETRDFIVTEHVPGKKLVIKPAVLDESEDPEDCEYEYECVEPQVWVEVNDSSERVLFVFDGTLVTLEI